MHIINTIYKRKYLPRPMSVVGKCFQTEKYSLINNNYKVTTFLLLGEIEMVQILFLSEVG